VVCHSCLSGLAVCYSLNTDTYETIIRCEWLSGNLRRLESKCELQAWPNLRLLVVDSLPAEHYCRILRFGLFVQVNQVTCADVWIGEDQPSHFFRFDCLHFNHWSQCSNLDFSTALSIKKPRDKIPRIELVSTYDVLDRIWRTCTATANLLCVLQNRWLR